MAKRSGDNFLVLVSVAFLPSREILYETAILFYACNDIRPSQEITIKAFSQGAKIWQEGTVLSDTVIGRGSSRSDSGYFKDWKDSYLSYSVR